MARPHDAADVPEDPPDLGEQPFAFERVCLDHRALFHRQGSGLVDDLARDPDLADVV